MVLQWVHLNQVLLLLLLSDSIVSNFLRPHGLQHARLLCPPPSLRVCSKFAQSLPTELMMPSNHLIHCPPPFLFLPSIFPSIRIFSSESTLCIRWPKHWSLSDSPSKEYSGLISLWNTIQK